MNARAAAIRVLRDEVAEFDALAVLALLAVRVVPGGSLGRFRSLVLRTGGFSIGKGALLVAGFTLTGGRRARRNLSIGRNTFINQGCTFDALGPIVIEDDVALGHSVVITTASHQIGSPDRRAGLVEPRGVRIGRGAWIASGAIILPGVDVGDGAVVAAGAVVSRSVPPNTLVGGVPARTIRDLPPN